MSVSFTSRSTRKNLIFHMKLAISLHDQDFASTKSIGIYNVAMGLTRGLAAHKRCESLDILSNAGLDNPLPEACAANVQYHLQDIPHPKKLKRVQWDQFGITQALNKIEPDWAILPKGFPPGLSWPRCKVCCYIHDTISDYYRKHPQNPFPTFEREYFPWLMQRAFDKADLIVTNSEFSRSEMLKHRPRARIEVLGIGFDEPPSPVSVDGIDTDLPSDGIVLLTSRLPHKLTPQALRWLSRWDEDRAKKLPITLVGGLPEDATPPDRPHWHVAGRLPHDSFQQLMRQNRVLIYFSEYEGYGMPPIEALRVGTAAIASDIPPHRENLPAKLLFSNHVYCNFEYALDRLLILKEPVKPPVLPTWEQIADKLIGLLGY